MERGRARRESAPAGAFVFAALAALGSASCRSAAVPPAFGAPVVLGPNGSAAPPGLARADERHRPALEAAREALQAGDDRAARAVLERLRLQELDAATLEIVEGAERILDGRAAVAALELALEVVYDPAQGLAVVWFAARTSDARALDVAPGPCDLRVEETSVTALGAGTRGAETIPVGAPLRFLVKEGAPLRIPIANLPLRAAHGALATRTAFEIEMRAGTIEVDGRVLPAQRFLVAGDEVVLLARELLGLELSSPAAFEALVAEGRCTPAEALSLAVRLPSEDREGVLDLLAHREAELTEPLLGALAPALRWMARGTDNGHDTALWRAFLRARRAARASRPGLVLPRGGPGEVAGS